ncbi:thyroid receptor-interacting protein 11-like isoform X2 [Coccinella septempunctata]|nr:thyroid receptor-interacting protein 11-like isoform X2 [Coccinella septempunctata]
MKNKLSDELENVTEKYEILNMKYNKLALAENGYKKKINELKNKCEELRSQDSLKNEKSNILEKCKLLEEENSELKTTIASLESARNNSENLTDSETHLASMASSIQELQMENKALKIALQTTSEMKTSKDNDKIFEQYENEIAQLKNELQNLKLENKNKDNKENILVETADLLAGGEFVEETSILKKEDALVKEQQDQIIELRNELETLRKDKEKEISNYLEQLKIKEVEKDEITHELCGVKKEKDDLEKNYIDLQDINRELKNLKYESEEAIEQRYEKQISDLMVELSELKHKITLLDSKNKETVKEVTSQFSHTLRENFKEYLDDQKTLPDDLESLTKSVSHQLKLKVASLENELQETNQSKVHLQNEKEEEIGRLLRDSEMLEQELSRKSKELADAEDECSQLMKNNELLISKLEELKENGLQTIFESNEDNVASLEKQLEIDSARISELESMLAGNCGKGVNGEESSSEENTQKLHKLEEENKNLQGTIEELKSKLHAAESERDNCRVVIDKMRLDYETTEYQFSEMNVNLETLSEEIEKHKARIDLLLCENENLKSVREEGSKTDEELELTKNELCIAKKESEDSMEKIRELVEKYELEKSEFEKDKEKLRCQVEDLMIQKTAMEKSVEENASEVESLKEELETCRRDNELLKDVFYSLSDGRVLDEGAQLDISKAAEFTNTLKERLENLEKENRNLTSELNTYKNKPESDDAQKELQNLMASRNELVEIVQTKHQEALTYHAEVQRLSEILRRETEKNMQIEKEIDELKRNSCHPETLRVKEEEIEKLRDQIAFLRQKCDVLAQSMLDEQQRVENEKLTSSEKEAALSKKLERLQGHLMEVEEHYTQELLQSEQQIALLQARLNEVEKREKDWSNTYTSVSIRANQQNESLTQQLQSMTSQRDEFCKRMLDLEDENNVKEAALTNLQLVLEQFQRDKEADVVRETERIRRQVKHEQQIQEDLRKEITTLENQIKESKQGLQAALRLTDQLEMSKNQVSTLKEEVSVLTEKLHHKEEELKAVTSQTDGKVDKSLVKNLVIGFVTSNKNLNKDQRQILKIIATVLDFNEQEHKKVNLNQDHQNTWLKSLLSPMADDVPPNESLSRAFVHFLENESKPRVIPSLLPQGNSSETSSTSASSARTSPTPIVLNEIVLPTFSDFPQHRNSSSILKGVLKDNP